MPTSASSTVVKSRLHVTASPVNFFHTNIGNDNTYNTNKQNHYISIKAQLFIEID